MTPDEFRTTVETISAQAAQLTSEPVDKPWWQSRTIWGALIVVLAQLGRLVEIDVDVEGMTDAALSLATLIGAVMAWWGRVQATRPISIRRVLPSVDVIGGKTN